MARYTTGTRIDFPEIEAIRRELNAKFAPNVRAKFLGAALKKATDPTKNALKQKTRQRFGKVSGNLLRAVASVIRRYPRTGNAVGLVGFTKAGGGKNKKTKGKILKGSERAYHAGLLIFGTKDRRTKSSIASSYKTRGPFQLKKKAKRGKFAGVSRVATVPKYPKAFFKKGSRGGGGVNVGRIYGNDVITETLRQNASSIRRILGEEMSTVVERATRFLAIKFPPRKS